MKKEIVNYAICIALATSFFFGCNNTDNPDGQTLESFIEPDQNWKSLGVYQTKSILYQRETSVPFLFLRGDTLEMLTGSGLLLYNVKNRRF